VQADLREQAVLLVQVDLRVLVVLPVQAELQVQAHLPQPVRRPRGPRLSLASPR
jgi:hypothetical protein